VDARIEEFMQYLSDEKGYAQNTITAYRNDLMQLADYLSTRLPQQGEPAELWPVVTKSASSTLSCTSKSTTTPPLPWPASWPRSGPSSDTCGAGAS